MKAFFSLIANALLLVSALVVVLGAINSVFGLSLGISIGGSDVSLLPDFFGNLGLAAVLLLLAGIFEFLSDPKKLFYWVKRHKVQTAVGLVVLCSLAYMTLFSLMGGAVGMAVESNDVAKIKTLLAEKKYAPEELNPHLYQALKAGHLEMARALIEGGADINMQSGEQDTPLLGSAVVFFPKPAVELLLELKADPNRVDRLGRSPAMLLVLYRWSSSPKETEADNLILFQKLVEGGTSLSHQESTGKSLLDVAKGQKATAYIEYLERIGGQ